MEKAGMERRAFLRGAALAGAGMALGAAAGGALADEAAPAGGEAPAAAAAEEPRKSPYAQINPQDFTGIHANAKHLEAVFTPWMLGTHEVRNRLVKSAAGNEVFPFGMKNVDQHASCVRYYGDIARGGAGVVWVYHCGQDNTWTTNKVNQVPWDQMTWMPDVVNAIHDAGAVAGYQWETESWGPAKKIESGVDSEHNTEVDLMTHEEIKQTQQDVITLALRLQSMGFDALEINSAGINVGARFMSRCRNHREDEYGPQSIENRARFVQEIIQGIKEACGDDFAVQVLFNAMEETENDPGLGRDQKLFPVEEGIQIAKIWEQAGADSFHLRFGTQGAMLAMFFCDAWFAGRGIDGTTSYGGQFNFKKHWGGRLIADHKGYGALLDVAAAYKAQLSAPVGTVGCNDPLIAPDFFNDAIADGKVDFFMQNRPWVADPDYGVKLQEGRLDEIRPCNRCMSCQPGREVGASGMPKYACRMNPFRWRANIEGALDQYGYDLPPIDSPKKVLVIGGGPAGMEAAVVAAQRGHNVTLVEKNAMLGGLLPFAEAIKGEHEHLDMDVAYFERQLELLGVTVALGQEADAEYVQAQAPDAVVVATGGTRAPLAYASTPGTSVISIDDVASAQIGEKVTVLGANCQALDLAWYLLEQGKQVDFVFPDEDARQLGKGQAMSYRNFSTPMVYAMGCKVWNDAQLEEVGDGTVTVLSPAGVPVTSACDTVIDASDMLPNLDLANQLTALGMDVRLAACDAPFSIRDSIRAGFDAAYQI